MNDSDSDPGATASAGGAAEIETLQAENERLRQQARARRSARRRRRGRALGVGVLVVLGSLMLLVAHLAVWVNATVLDTSNWVDTVRPLSQDEAVTDAVADRLTQQIFDAVDAEKVTEEALPDRAQVLATPLVGVLHDFVSETVAKALRTDQFQTIWTEANRLAHGQALGFIRGDRAVHGEGGTVVLDLSGVLETTNQLLTDGGVDLFDGTPPPDLGRITIVQEGQLSEVESAVDYLDRLDTWTPIVALGFYGAALWLAVGRRRRTLIAIGLGAAATMLVAGLVARIGRNTVLDGIADAKARAAADATWDIVLRRLRAQTIGLFVLGLVIAGLAWATGPSARAVALRGFFSRLIAQWSEGAAGERTPPALTALLRPRRRAAEATAAVVAFVILLLLPRLTAGSVLVVALLLLLAVGAIELVAGKPSPPPDPTDSNPTDSSPEASAPTGGA